MFPYDWGPDPTAFSKGLILAPEYDGDGGTEQATPGGEAITDEAARDISDGTGAV